MMYKTSRCYLL